MAERRLAAVDLGAGSGRVAVGRFDGARVDLEVVHRFGNRPLWLPDGLHWNLPQLFADTLAGLAAAAQLAPLHGIGVDAWGCDYALLDESDRMLGLPYHYRDPARSSAAIVARAFERVGRRELYARTGIQTMPINTIFQLVAEAGSAAAAAAHRIALIPDLIGLWLTGTLANEVTAASSTGLLEARGLRWAADLAERLGIPAGPFGGEAVPPGVELGSVLPGNSAAGDAVGATVRTVAGHDTASAFAAAATAGTGAAVLSSGTWSLLGLELPEPELGTRAEAFNLTNERGIGGTTRLLRNVMGMWLIEECRREWGGPTYEELYRAAESASGDVPLFDPDDESLLHPGAMTPRIAALWSEPVADRATVVRSILLSLACKYRVVLEQLEVVSARRIDTVQVVGGGAHNRLLCQLTADVTQREVLAGPEEATLLGNVLVQLQAIGELGTIEEMRELAAAAVPLTRYEPHDAGGLATYERFLERTGAAVEEIA